MTCGARFLAEAALGRKIQHPGLVPTWDVIVEGSWLGTVMAFVAGQSLSSSVRAGGLPVSEVLRLLAPVGETLDHLHGQGIVHRDVKPANVVVRTGGRPVLLDLGIAKDTAAGEAHTRTMTAMGTSAWMAPEQADAKHVDGAADRYAFGLMAYALLVGRMPWDDGTSEFRVVSMKLTNQLTPIASLRSDLPAHVAAAVSKMLSVAPGDRYASCSAFVAALSADASAPTSTLSTATPLSPSDRGAAASAAPSAESPPPSLTPPYATSAPTAPAEVGEALAWVIALSPLLAGVGFLIVGVLLSELFDADGEPLLLIAGSIGLAGAGFASMLVASSDIRRIRRIVGRTDLDAMMAIVPVWYLVRRRGELREGSVPLGLHLILSFVLLAVLGLLLSEM